MDARELEAAVSAARSSAAALGLPADAAIVLHNSNRIAVRLLPSDTLARVAPAAYQDAHPAGADFELRLAQGLAQAGAPVAGLEPRVAPKIYRHDRFAVTFWTYYEPSGAELS